MRCVTLIRLKAPLRMARKRIRTYTVPRPLGWEDTIGDLAKWHIMLRKQGRNDTTYSNKA